MYKIILRSSDSSSFKRAISKVLCQLPPKSSFVRLPEKRKIFSVLRSPHVNKKSREQFKLCSYKRLLDIYSSSSKTIDALMKLELPSGVEVEIKV